MAGVYLMLAGLVSQVGIGDAILNLRDLTFRKIAELNTVALLVGVALVGISCGVAGPLANFFSAPPLRLIVIVASSTYILNSLQVVPSALLRKELRFKLLSVLETIRTLIQILATIGLALLGFRYWSLVFGVVVGVCVTTLLMLFARPHSFAWPSFRKMGRELRFSAHMMSLRHRLVRV